MVFAGLAGKRHSPRRATAPMLLMVFADASAGHGVTSPPWRTFQLDPEAPTSGAQPLQMSVAEYDAERGLLQNPQGPTSKLVRECRRLFDTDCKTPPEIEAVRLPPNVLLLLRQGFGGRKVGIVLRKPDGIILSYLMTNGRAEMVGRSA